MNSAFAKQPKESADRAQIKLTKPKSRILGVAAVAIVFAGVFLCCNRPEELTVHLVDKTGNPMKCAVNAAAYHLFYLPSWLERFLENYDWFRRSFYNPTPKRSSYVAKGKFQIRRLSNQNDRRWYVITIRGNGSRADEEVKFEYKATVNGHGEVRLAWPGNIWDQVDLEPGQTEVTFPIELSAGGGK